MGAVPNSSRTRSLPALRRSRGKPRLRGSGGERPSRKYPVAKTREGKRVATVYLEPEALRQLKRIGFDEETTVQELLVEGINAVFEKRGLSRIA